MRRAALLLGALLAVLFFPFVFGDKSLLSSARDVPSILPIGAYGDSPRPNVLKAPDAGAAGWQFEPAMGILHREVLSEHAFPIWNPYSAFGAPLAANMHYQPYYPLSALYALAPSPRAYNWYILIRLFIAGVGMWAFLRYFVGFAPALLGGIAMMLTGYYIMYYDMPHLSVEVLLPALLFCVEFAMRSPGASSFAATFVVSNLIITGGMPESAILVLGLGYLYLLARCAVTIRAQVRSTVTRAATFLGAHALGVAAASIVILPFLEFQGVSFNLHDPAVAAVPWPGIVSDHLDFSIFEYVAPLLFGPTRNNIFSHFDGYSGLRGYWGIIVALFATIAVLSACGRWLNKQRHATDWILAFFTVVAVLMIAKRYGWAGINWIGTLPGLHYVVFPKYEEVITGMAVAAMAAFGLDAFIDGRIQRWAVAVAGALWLLALTFAYTELRPLLPGSSHGIFFQYAFGVALISLAVAALIAIAACRMPEKQRRLSAFAIAALAAAELSIAYIVPLYYVVNPEPTVAADPYRGAPYVTYLESVAQPAEARVYGKDGYLYPSWSGVFGLANLTHVDALFYNRYLTFVHAFLAKPGATVDDFYDRFSGVSNNDFGSAIERRFLQISSAKYVVALRLNTGKESLYSSIAFQLSALPAATQGQLLAQTITLGPASFDGFLLQPPLTPLTFSISIPPKANVLSYRLGRIEDAGAVGCGRITSHLVLLDGGRTVAQLTTELPSRSGAWKPAALDIRSVRGKSLLASFALDVSGASGCLSSVAWADMHFDHPDTAGPGPVTFRRTYLGTDAAVYQVDPVLPRATLYHTVATVADKTEALRRIVAPGFDIFSQAVVESPAGALADHPAARAGAAAITEYGPTRISIAADDPQPALLMLNDTNYPGWTAEVDARPAPVLATDYLFRGVFLPPGHHLVVFRYSPPSFRIGLAISIAAILVALVCILALARRARLAEAGKG